MTTEVMEGYLLSTQQLHVWHAQRGLDAHPFVTTVRLRIEGPLDPARLARALRVVVNRHDVLRTTYSSVGGAPLQVVQPAAAELALDRLRIADTRGDAFDELPGVGRAADLHTAPMLRAALQRIDADQHVLLMAMPAIASDTASAHIVASEVARAYAADSADGTGFEEVAQYLQYNEYQQQWSTGDEARDLRDRWAALSLPAPPLGLVAARVTPSPPHIAGGTASAANARRFVIARHDVPLETASISALRDACVRLGIAPESGLAAVWHVLLARFSGQAQFQLSHEFDGRTFDELAALPGAFARVVPIGIEIDAATSFADMAVALDRRLEGLRACQDGFVTPDPHVGMRADIEAHTDVQFTFAAFREEYDAGECRMRLDAIWSCQAPFGFRLHAVDRGTGLELAVECDRDRADAPLAKQLAASYAVLAATFAADPHLSIGVVPLLSVEQRRRIIVDWNRTDAAVSDRRFVHERFEAQVERQPMAIALRADTGDVTFAELDARASRIAAWLRARGARPESIVAIVAAPSVGAVAGILGVLKSGAAYLPIDPSLPSERVTFMLRDANVVAVLTDQELSEAAGWPSSEEIAPRVPLRPDHAAYVIYTSGSTGTPKGVVITHGGLANYLDWCQAAYVDADGSVVATGAPLHSSLSFDLSVTSLFGPLVMGLPIALAPPDADARVEGLTRVLREHESFAWVKVTPGHARLLGERLGAEALGGRTRRLIVGGEALTEADVRVWRAGAPDTIILNEYGPTEAVVGCAVHQLGATPEDPVPIGRPIHHARLYVLDANLDPVPPGVIGELFIGGDGLARGYLGRPELTADRFMPNPFAGIDPAIEAGARVYRTGDLARYRDDGVLLYHGRWDDQIKLRGYRIELGEIEAALVQHPGVREAAVVLRHDDQQAPRLVAYFTERSDEPGALSIAELRTFLGARLPEYMVPAMFVPLPRLPLTRHGKVDRRALPGPDQVESSHAYVGPRTLEEEALAEIWAKVLGLRRVGIDDDYFVLGGDSIRAIQVAGVAGQRGFDVTIDLLFRHRTIRELARALNTGDAGGAPVSRATEPFALVTPEDRARMPEDVVDAYPLSALQAGMIFHRAYHPESAIYHDMFGYHLRMPLDVPKLEAAAGALVERHPALRTAVHLDGFSEPLQLVHRTTALPLHVTDIRDQSTEEQERTLRDWLEQEKRRGFAEHERPMLRFHVHIRSAETFELFLSFHHAVLDGWSDANMLLELAISYQALLDGEPIPFVAPQTAYREFIALERDVMRSEAARRFWTERLAGATPLVLPRWRASAFEGSASEGAAEKTNGSGASGAAEAGSESRGVLVQTVPIAREASDALRQLARSLAVPLKSVLLAAHMRVLSSLGGTTDVVSSLSVAGRPETSDANQVLGLHINSTPIRLSLEGGTWIELIQDAFREERDALPYRRYPLAEVQRLAGVRRLVETSFYYTHYHNIEPLARLPRFEIVDRLIYEETSFGVVANFNLDPFSDRLGLTLACDQTQFDAAQRQWIGDYYERALTALVADPSARYERVDLMTERERTRLLAFGTGTATASDRKQPIAPPERELVHEQIHDRACATPQAVAVTCGDRRLTYAELDARARQIADALRASGAGPDRLVGLCVGRSVEMVAGVLGILKAGAAYLPLDPDYPQDRLELMIRDAQPDAVLASDAFVGRARATGARVMSLDALTASDTANPAADASATPAPALRPANAAYVIYTSGSTGRPKGTLVSHGNLARSTAARLAYYREPVSAFLLLSSYGFDSSVAGLFWTLTTGGTLVVPTAEALRDPDAILTLLERHAVSHTLALPSLYGAVLDAAALDGEALGAGRACRAPALRTVIVAGEACSPRVGTRHHEVWPHVRLFNEYGPTEATVWSTVAELRPDGELGTVPIGAPIPGARAYVLDAQGHLAPLSAPGELFVGGPGVTRGYLGAPGATAALFVPDPFEAVPGARMYRTGDACRLRADGQIEFLGRRDHQVKIRGHRVELGEIEAALRAEASVEDAAVIAREQAPGDVRLVACVVAPKKAAIDRQHLRERLQRTLPEFMLPSHFVFLDALPRTTNGKLDRAALRAAEDASGQPERPYVPPSDTVEATLAAIWQDVLKVDRVGIDDDFFLLGGDSILSIQIIARARREGLRVTPADLFQCRTIAALRQRVQVQEEAVATSPAAAKTSAAGASGMVRVGVSEQQAAALLETLTPPRRG